MHKGKAFQSKACQRKTDSGQNLPVQNMNWGKSCHYSFFPMEKALTGQFYRGLWIKVYAGERLSWSINVFNCFPFLNFRWHKDEMIYFKE